MRVAAVACLLQLRVLACCAAPSGSAFLVIVICTGPGLGPLFFRSPYYSFFFLAFFLCSVASACCTYCPFCALSTHALGRPLSSSCWSGLSPHFCGCLPSRPPGPGAPQWLFAGPCERLSGRPLRSAFAFADSAAFPCFRIPSSPVAQVARRLSFLLIALIDCFSLVCL